jgi:hypothetical protein
MRAKAPEQAAVFAQPIQVAGVVYAFRIVSRIGQREPDAAIRLADAAALVHYDAVYDGWADVSWHHLPVWYQPSPSPSP